MGVGIGVDKSKKNVVTNETTTNAATGYGSAEGAQSSVIAGLTAADGGEINVTTSDYGAIESGRDIALRSLDVTGESLMEVLTGARESGAASRALTQQAIESSIGLASEFQKSDDQRSAGEFRKLVLVLAVTVGAVFVAPLLFKRG